MFPDGDWKLEHASACTGAANPTIADATAPEVSARVTALTRWRREVLFMGQGCACGLGGFSGSSGDYDTADSTTPRLMTLPDQAAQSIPNASAKAARPSSVTVTARPRVTRFTQPAETKRSRTAWPNGPTGGGAVPSGPRVPDQRSSCRRQFDSDIDSNRLPRIRHFVVDFMSRAAQRVCCPGSGRSVRHRRRALRGPARLPMIARPADQRNGRSRYARSATWPPGALPQRPNRTRGANRTRCSSSHRHRGRHGSSGLPCVSTDNRPASVSLRSWLLAVAC